MTFEQWWKMRTDKTKTIKEVALEAWEAAYEKGYDAGHAEGYEQGYIMGQDDEYYYSSGEHEK